jgi:hypothetical protein
VAAPLVREGCGLPQRTRFARTFAGREVFFPAYTPPGKTDLILFALCGRELCEAFSTECPFSVEKFTLWLGRL